jgi:hypothetical protein
MRIPLYLRFWNPDSGIIGGFIAGALFMLTLAILGRIFL